MNFPLYTLHAHTISACFKLRINDIPVITEKSGKPISAELPINHFMINGYNRIEVDITPPLNEAKFTNSSNTTFQLFLRNLNELSGERSMLIKLNPLETSDNEQPQPKLYSTHTFAVNYFDSPPWTEAPRIKLNEDLIHNINQLYKTFFLGLKNKDVNQILAITSERNKLLAKYYNKEINEQERVLKESILDALEDPNYVLIDYDKQERKIEIHGNGKLMTIVNKDSRSPLQFYNGRTNVTKSFPLFVSHIENKAIIIL